MKAEPRKPDESPPPPDTLSSETLNATVYRDRHCLSPMRQRHGTRHQVPSLSICALELRVGLFVYVSHTVVHC